MGYFTNGLRKLFRGTTANDGSGTDARTGASRINDNMDDIDSALEAIDTAAEKKANKVNNLDAPNETNYPTSQAVKNAVDQVQSTNQQYTSDQLANYQAKSEKGQADGYASLDSNAKVPAAQMYAVMDEIIEGEYIDATTFNDEFGNPVTPGSAKLYQDTTTGNPTSGKQYRWSGSQFSNIPASPGTTDEVPEGSINKYFSESRVLASVLTGFNTISGYAVNAADSVLSAIGKLQGQINTLTTSIGNKLDKGTYTGTAQDLKTLIDAKETPLGAQSKADSAYTSAVDYANNLLKQGIAERYLTTAALIADQANQEDKGVYLVVDASGDTTVTSGYAYYEYKGTTVGDLTDYRKLNEEESQDVDHSVFALDSEVVKGVLDSEGNSVVTNGVAQLPDYASQTQVANIEGRVVSLETNYEDLNITWNTGESKILNVTDSSKVTAVYVNGDRLVKDIEWSIFSATEIEILNTLNDEDSIVVERGRGGVVNEFKKGFYSLDIDGFNTKEKFVFYSKRPGTQDIYVGFNIVHQYDMSESVYADLWRIAGAGEFQYINGAMVDLGNVIMTGAESECTYNSGGDDFVGGFHGDELLTDIKFFADGVEISNITADIPLTVCDEFSYRQKSTMHQAPSGGVPDPNHTVEAIHHKITSFKNASYTTFNRLVPQYNNVPIGLWYHGISCIGKVNGELVANDFLDYEPVLGDDLEKLHQVGGRKYFSSHETNGLSAYAESKLLRPENKNNGCEMFVWDRVSDTKYYRKFLPVDPIVAGDIWESEMTVKFDKI